MPIYEYNCKACGHDFEDLVMGVDAPAPLCPKCDANNVQKLMSAGSFRPQGIPTGSGGYKAPSCRPAAGG